MVYQTGKAEGEKEMTQTEIEYVEEIKALKEEVKELRDKMDTGYFIAEEDRSNIDRRQVKNKLLKAENKRLKDKIAELGVALAEKGDVND